MSIFICCSKASYVYIEKLPNPFESYFEITSNSKDSAICFGENVTLHLYIKNNTDSIIEFINNNPFFMIHDYGDNIFIAGEENGRIHIQIDSKENNKKIIINPHETYKSTYEVIIKKEFFYPGKNTLRLLLHFQNYISTKTEPKSIVVKGCY